MRIALVNPNTNSAATQMMCAIAADAAPHGWVIDGITAPMGVPLIAAPAHLAEAADAMAGMADSLGGYDGVIVAAFGDPGVPVLKLALPVPVVGLAEASMKAAVRHGRFSIVHTTKDLETSMTHLAQDYGYLQMLACLVEAPGNAFALLANPALLVRRLREAVETAAAGGVDAVIIGGGVLADAARTLAPQSPVPLIEPVPAAVALLAQYMGGPQRGDEAAGPAP